MYASAIPEDTTKCYNCKEKNIINVVCPYSVQQYNMFMGGVDIMDRMVSHYAHAFKDKKMVSLNFLSLFKCVDLIQKQN